MMRELRPVYDGTGVFVGETRYSDEAEDGVGTDTGEHDASTLEQESSFDGVPEVWISKNALNIKGSFGVQLIKYNGFVIIC